MKHQKKLYEAVSESHVILILKYLAQPHNVYQNPYNQFTIISNGPHDLLPASRELATAICMTSCEYLVQGDRHTSSWQIQTLPCLNVLSDGLINETQKVSLCCCTFLSEPSSDGASFETFPIHT